MNASGRALALSSMLAALGFSAAAWAQSPGDLHAGLNPGTGADSRVLAVARHADGRLIVGGQFTVFNGLSRRRLTQLNYDGSTDLSFNPGTAADGTINAVAAAADGKVVVGGDFLTFNGLTRTRLARLNANGSVDTTFAPTVNGTVQAVAVQPDGKVLLAGGFSVVNGVARSRVARLNSDGTLDTGFNPGAGPNSSVLALSLQTDGRVLLGGYFWQVNGVARNRVARLNANGSLDTDFVPGTHDNGYVNGISVGADGKVFVCGGLYVGLNSRILRLHPTGALDAGFNPGNNVINSDVTSAVAQDDGKVVIGGYFTAINGVSRPHVARLNINGTLDTAFNPGVGASDYIWTMIMEPDGALVAGGAFTTYQGVSRNRLTRIQNSPPLNPPPQLDVIANLVVAEDSGPVTVNVTGIAPGSPGEVGRAVTNLTATSYAPGILPHPTVTYTPGGATATLTLQPVADAYGTVTVSVVVQDNGPAAATGVRTFTVTVTPVNDAPSFALGVPVGSPNITIAEDSGAYSAASFASSISAGPANESAQTVSFLTSNTASNLFSAQPVIAANGTLSFTPAANAFGSATVSVTAVDGGGAPGVSNSAVQTFTIEITNLNDPPAVAFASTNVVVLEDAAAASSNDFLSLSAGPFGEPGTASLISVANNNHGLFAVQPFFTGGTLAFTAAPNAHGVATVTVIAQDDTLPAGLFGTNTFTITVTPVNDAPTLTLGVTTLSVLTNIGTVSTNLAPVTTVGPANETGQSITNYTVSNDNNALFTVQPALALNGTLTFTVAGHLTGAANVSIRAQDNGGTLNGGANLSAVVNVTINVGGPNQVPTFTLATNNVVVAEDSGAASHPDFLTSLSAGEVTQSVTNLAVSNNNSALFSAQPAISGGTLTFTPAADATGVATVTVRATDDGLAPAVGTQTFTITVTAVNDAPSFTLNSAVVPVILAEDGGAQSLALAVTNISAGPANESAQTVTFLTSNTASNLFSSQPVIAANGTLTFTPAPNAWGTITVSVRAQDSGGTANGGVDTSAAQTFTITITNINDAPAITFATNNLVVSEDAGSVSRSDFLSLSPGPFSEPGTVAITSLVNNNNSLFSVQPAFTGGTLTFTPAANAFGVATVTVIAQDDTLPTGLFSTNSFTITVLSVNDAPTLTLTNLTINLLTNAGGYSANLGATVSLGPPNESTQGPVSFLITNSNNALFTTQPYANQGGYISFSVAPGVQGTATLYVRVRDTGGTANGGVDVSDPVLVTVNITPGNAAPSFTLGATSITKLEDAGPTTSNLFLTALSAGPQPLDASQTVTLTVANNNAALFSAPPALSGSGTTRDLTFTPAANANGVATVTITATDNGAPPLSTVQTVTINVLSVNDAPVITFASNNIALENAGAQSLGGFATITAGPAAESSQTVTNVSVSNDNNALFSVQPALTNGTLTFTPVLNASGVATVSVIAQDNGGTANGGVDRATNTFTIAISVVNQAPSFNLRLANTAASPIVNGSFETGDFTGWTVSDTANTTPSLAVRADGANLGIFNVLSTDGTKSATHGFGGTSEGIISIGQDVTVPANASAQLTFTYRIAWNTIGSAATSNRVFRVSVQPAGGGAELGGQTLLTAAPNTFGVQAANQSVSLDLTPYAGQIVRVAFVAIIPAGDTANGGFQMDSVSVTINTPDFSVYENSGASSTLNYATNILAGPANESAQTVAFLVSNNNNALFSTQPAIAANGTLTFTPALDANGVATVTVVAQDNGGTANGGVDTSAPRTFLITVLPVNSAPRVTVTTASVVVNEDSAAFSGAVTTITTGPADESSQSITNVATSNDNNSLFSVQPAVSASGVLTFTLAANQNGSATVTFTPQDNGGTANGGVNQTTRTLTITVTAVNDAPSFALPAGTGTAQLTTVSTLAGSTSGNADGTGAAAQFNSPYAVAADSAGNVYVADYGNHRIRKVTPTGVVTTFAGSTAGYADGTGTAAQFNQPFAVAVDGADNVFVGEYGNNRIRKITPGGVVTTPNYTNSAGAAFSFGLPVALTFDGAGNLYTVHGYSGILKITPNGLVTVLAGVAGYSVGYVDATGGAARFDNPLGLAADSAGNVYVSEYGNDISQSHIRKITPAGVVTTLAGSTYGFADGTGTAAQFRWLWGVVVDPSGTVYVADTGNNCIRKITAAGVVTTLSSTAGYVDGALSTAKFSNPLGMAMDRSGNIYVADQGNQRIRKIASAIPSFELAVLEDSGAYTTNTFATSISPGPADESAQTVSFTVSNNNNPIFSSQPAIAPDGTLTFTPAANAFGSATVTVTAVDSGSGTPPNVNTSVAQTFTITVTGINDQPSVTLAGNVTRNEDSGAYSQSSFATFSAGNASESGQAVLAYTVSNDNTSLFSAQPAINTSGTLTFTPAANANGVATVTVSVRDNGGTANGGVDTSASVTFTITITAVNDAPSFSLNGGVLNTGSGGGGGSGDGLIVGGATYYPAGGATVLVAPDLTYSNSVSSTTAGAAVSIDNGQTGDVLGFNATLATSYGISGSYNSTTKVLSFTGSATTAQYQEVLRSVTYSNAAGTPTSDRTISFNVGLNTLYNPLNGHFYEYVPTVISWAAAQSAATNRIFQGMRGYLATITSQAENDFIRTKLLADAWIGGSDDFTYINAAVGSTLYPDQNAAENKWYWVTGPEAGQQFSTGSTSFSGRYQNWAGGEPNNSGQEHYAQFYYNNNGRWNDLRSTHTLAYMVEYGGQAGDVTSTLSLTGSRTLTYNPVLQVVENSGLNTYSLALTNISAGPADESAQLVDFIVSNNNGTLFSTPPAIAADGTLTFTLAANVFGSATVTVQAHDNGGTANGGVDTSAAKTFTIVVNNVNEAPTVAFSAATVTALEDSGVRTVSGFATVTSFGAGESSQTLLGHVLTAANPALFSVPPAINTSGVLTFTPATNANGSTTVTVVSQDSGGTANGGVDKTTNTFTITITPVNDAPSFGLSVGSGGGSGGGVAAQGPWTVSTFATGFNRPIGMVRDSAGNLFVVDAFNHAIRKVTPAGVVTTFAGTVGTWGTADGTGTAAGFETPGWIAIDAADNLYVTDGGNGTVRKITPAAVVTTLAGLARNYGSTDGTGSNARFNYPTGVAVDGAGNVYVAEGNNNTIRKITPAGVVTTLAGTAGTSGGTDGTGAAARFNAPMGMGIDSAGNLYVGEQNGHTVRKITPAGVVTTVAGLAGTSGAVDGTGSAARFLGPQDVKVDAAGNLLVADMGNHAIRQVTSAGVVTTIIGALGSSGLVNGNDASVRLSSPRGLLIDTTGTVYIADYGNNVLRKAVPAVAAVAGAGPNTLAVLEDSGAYAGGANFATNILAGPADESGQAVDFLVSNDNTALFSSQPAIAANGTLTFTPAANAFGSATVTVRAHDDGGTANGGVDTSAAQTFVIQVNNVNDAPSVSFAASTVTRLEDSGAQSVNSFATFTLGTGESGQSITNVVTSNDNNALFSSQPSISTGGTLTFTPAANANGSATVTVVAQDNGGTANGGVDTSAPQTFTITITPVNDAPSFVGYGVTTNRSLTAWGGNGAGESTIPAGLSGITAISANGTFSLALRDNGTVVAWGNNNSGQTTIPAGLANVLAISAGYDHSLALKSDGTVVAWGYNGNGQTSVPAGLSSVVAIAGGGFHSLALKGDGTVVAWGGNQWGQSTVPAGLSGVTAIAAARNHSVALKSDGTVVAWGDNSSGQLNIPAGLSGVVAISANTFHTMALRGDGTVVSWGASVSGQPAGLTGVIAIAAGGYHNAVLKSDGTVVAWGANWANQINVPAGLSGVIKLAAGIGHNLALVETVSGMSPVIVLEDAGPQTQPNLATSISAGPADESAQVVDFLVTNDNNALFSSQPAVDANGTLTFTSAPNAVGSATVTIRAHDNGGTANGGVDTSAAQTFTITVNPVNDAPSVSFAASTVTRLEDSGAASVSSFASFSPGPANESAQTVSVLSVTAANTSLFSAQPAIAANGTLTFTPAANANGSSLVTVVVQDNGGTANGGLDTSAPQTFTITIAPVNDVPSFVLPTVTTSSGRVLVLGAAPVGNQSDVVSKITAAGTFAQVDSRLVTVGNPTPTLAELMPYDAVIVYSDNVFGDQAGLGNVLADYSDAGKGVVVATFALHNSYGGQLLGRLVTSGYLPFTQGSQSSGSQLTLVADQSLHPILAGVASFNGGSSGYHNNPITLTSGASLIAHWSNGQPLIGVKQLTAGRVVALNFYPPSSSARSDFWQASTDGGRIMANALTWAGPPTVVNASVTILEDAGLVNSNSFATSISAGPANESAQLVDFLVSNDNNALFSSQPAVDANGTLTFTPALNAVGSATVTIRAHDNGGTANGGVDTSAAQTFTITVNPVNDAPSVSFAASTVTRLEDSGAASVSSFASFSPGPANESAQTVSVLSVTAANTSLFSAQPAIAANGTLTFTPAANANGSSLVTVVVQDNGGTANGGLDTSAPQTFTITITAVNDAPSFALNGGVLNTGSGGGGSGDGLIVGGATYYPAGGATVLVAPDLTYSNSVSSTTAGAAVSIDNGQTGDVLGFNATLATSYGISGSYNSTTKVLSFTGSATTAQYQEVLRSVTYSNAAGTPTSDRTISFNVGLNTLYNPLNGHFYEYISSGLTWTSAKAAAEARTFQGMQGYLATVTSQAENDFIQTKLQADAWIGASDDVSYVNAALTAIGQATYANQSAVEGKWYWVTGPEKGLQFSQNNGSPVSVNGMFKNWRGGEPNNAGNEHYAEFYVTGGWNDLPNITLPYVVEYGGQAGDVTSTLALSGSRTLTYNPVLQVAENSGLKTYSLALTNISAGPANESSQAVDFLVSNDNTALFSSQPTIAANGTLSFTLASFGTGSATVTVRAHDDGGTDNGGVDTSAAQTFTITVTPAATRVFISGTPTAAVGDTLTVPVMLKAAGTESGVGFTLNFDATKLTYASSTLGAGAAGASLVVNPNSSVSGSLGIVVAKSADASFSAGTNELVLVTFFVKTTAATGSSPVTFGDSLSRREITDATAATVSGAFADGSVSLTAAVSGTPSTLEGDVSPRANGNGSVTVADSVQIGRFASGLDTPTTGTGGEFQRADCAPLGTKGDGRITVSDWVQSLRFASGLDTPGTVGGPTVQATALAASSLRVPAGNRVVRVVGGNLTAGSTGTVTVQMDAQGNESGLSLSLAFDPTALTFVSAAVGNGANGGSLMVNSVKAAAGKLGLVLVLPAGSTVAAGTRDVITITFNVAGSGTTVVNVTGDSPVAREVADVNANVLGASFVGGSFNIILPAGLKAAGMERAADGSVRLVVRNSDGTAVTAAQAAKYEVQVTSNLGGAWTVLPNALVVENGALKIVDPAAGSAGLRLYKLVERP